MDRPFIDLDPKRHRTGGAMLSRPPRGSRRFAILRVNKIKNMSQIVSAARHNLRQMEVPNADHERSPDNLVLVGPEKAEDVAEKWQERAPEKVRSNAVRALEYVVTASPEAMQKMGADNAETYLRDALEWLKDRHGAENVLSAVIHKDETTPHLQAMVIPLDDKNRLNARSFVNGPKGLAEMQTDFAQKVGAEHGLERGMKKSRAQHTKIKEYYAGVTTASKLRLELPERNVERGFWGRKQESDEEWHQRATESASEALRSVVATMQAENIEAAREAAQSAQETITELQNSIGEAQARQRELQEVCDKALELASRYATGVNLLTLTDRLNVAYRESDPEYDQMEKDALVQLRELEFSKVAEEAIDLARDQLHDIGIDLDDLPPEPFSQHEIEQTQKHEIRSKQEHDESGLEHE